VVLLHLLRLGVVSDHHLCLGVVLRHLRCLEVVSDQWSIATSSALELSLDHLLCLGTVHRHQMDKKLGQGFKTKKKEK